MSCNGWNHSPSCDCGWGGVWHGNVPYGGGGAFWCNDEQDSTPAVSIHRLIEAGYPRKLTIPNAKCPVCRAEVFFYQNEYGSRVFFDRLGPPWPKHPCTDNSRFDSPASSKIIAARLEAESRPKLWTEGWRPCVIYHKDVEYVILKDLGTDEFMRLTLNPDRLSNIFPVVFTREYSKRELILSYFHGGIRSERRITVQFKDVVRRDCSNTKAQADRTGLMSDLEYPLAQKRA
jgi:hypothetical protein